MSLNLSLMCVWLTKQVAFLFNESSVYVNRDLNISMMKLSTISYHLATVPRLRMPWFHRIFS